MLKPIGCWLARTIACLVVSTAAAASAQETVPPTPVDAPVMDTVLVTGEQPGPGLWKVSSGDHELWILGTWTPLPQGMSWRSKQAEELIAQSQEVLTPPKAKVEIGFFHKLFLMPSLIGISNNRGHEKLKDVLPPELYARWQTLKQRYIGDDKGIESKRPVFAARELYRKVIAKSGLTTKNDALSLVQDIARKHQVKVTEVKVGIDIDSPRQTIRSFRNAPIDSDIACLRATMDRLETDLAAMKRRANAWASGDLESLRDLPYTDQNEACISAFSSTPGLGERIEEAQAQVSTEWLRAAEAALARNASTFAVVPLNELTARNGWLDQLRERGYSIEAPE